MIKMIWIMVKKSISIFIITELLVIASYFISFEFFMNIQISFISSFAIIVGASFAYSKMVSSHVEADLVDQKRDLLDEIEDPHELYDEKPINNAPADELDLKAIVKEERSKIKTLSVKSMKHGVRGSVSLFRLLPYLFLVLGFIALKNNELLDISIYLPSLLVGIVIGSLVSKGLVKQ